MGNDGFSVSIRTYFVISYFAISVNKNTQYNTEYWMNNYLRSNAEERRYYITCRL